MMAADLKGYSLPEAFRIKVLCFRGCVTKATVRFSRSPCHSLAESLQVPTERSDKAFPKSSPMWKRWRVFSNGESRFKLSKIVLF